MSKKTKKGKKKHNQKPVSKQISGKTTQSDQLSKTEEKPSHGGGPQTEEGKAISSKNSLVHGFTAKTVVLPGENLKEYEVLREGMMKDLHPVGEFETDAVMRYIDNCWRLRRFASREAEILSTIRDIAEQNRQLTLLGRYERSIRRNKEKDLEEFKAHKRNREFDEIENIREERIARANGEDIETHDLAVKAYRVMRQTMDLDDMLKYLSQPLSSDHFEFVLSGCLQPSDNPLQEVVQKALGSSKNGNG